MRPHGWPWFMLLWDFLVNMAKGWAQSTLGKIVDVQVGYVEQKQIKIWISIWKDWGHALMVSVSSRAGQGKDKIKLSLIRSLERIKSFTLHRFPEKSQESLLLRELRFWCASVSKCLIPFWGHLTLMKCLYWHLLKSTAISCAQEHYPSTCQVTEYGICEASLHLSKLVTLYQCEWTRCRNKLLSSSSPSCYFTVLLIFLLIHTFCCMIQEIIPVTSIATWR